MCPIRMGVIKESISWSRGELESAGCVVRSKDQAVMQGTVRVCVCCKGQEGLGGHC